jgi:tRNA(fMet)-specific endonuclease VapC
MLDTNIVSALVANDQRAITRLSRITPEEIFISAISYAEIQFGLAKRPDSMRLKHAMEQFLERVVVLPWSAETAHFYGTLRFGLQKRGLTVQPLDLLIAAHALHVGATLVTADKAFAMIPGLKQENWLA